ncbi:Heterokaryon incompatibility protein 6, OR allele [Colletotrichum spinosum]|uniref:Heterokaryon incompatibility protein 6, OR allele n=1 Tax=Colletotrichum spinosum TaxID=1347390 RepID=A0A4R8PVG1_9PEZI|nr:Heterokaryon incompatibility protein 6, OR allele [Colletotrichum spinosum]
MSSSQTTSSPGPGNASDRRSIYAYAPLPSPRHTRLVVLRRGATKDPSCPLSCDLVDADVDEPPPYYALSYTWDGETPSEPLTICNTADATSTSAGGQLLITPNRAAALRVFRKSLHKRFRRRKQVTVWIDAICINQTSDHDKNVQVAMMAEIYRAAKRVVVWFGERDSPATPIPLISSLPCALFPRDCPEGLEPILRRLKKPVASVFFKGWLESLGGGVAAYGDGGSITRGVSFQHDADDYEPEERGAIRTHEGIVRA